jgi:hypothetical protein
MRGRRLRLLRRWWGTLGGILAPRLRCRGTRLIRSIREDGRWRRRGMWLRDECFFWESEGVMLDTRLDFLCDFVEDYEICIDS